MDYIKMNHGQSMENISLHNCLKLCDHGTVDGNGYFEKTKKLSMMHAGLA